MKNKYTTIGVILLVLIAIQSKAQLYIQGNSILIQSAATIHIDGLSLTPAVAINLINNEINHLESAIVGSPYPSINRIYKVDSKTPFTGKIGMRYQPSELNGNDENLLQFSFGDENLTFTVPTNKSTVDVNKHYIEEDVVSQELWAITATTSGSFLPVKLVDFTAISQETSAHIAWSTSEETNSDYFEIQHSTNGKQWTNIGEVKAEGESKAIKTYTFQHTSPVEGNNFYRLKMIDQDGSFAYSRVRKVDFKIKSQLTLHPNPVSDFLTVAAADLNSLVRLEITNMSGHKVREIEEQQLQSLSGGIVDVKDLPSGMYIFNITSKDGSVRAEKIFKN